MSLARSSYIYHRARLEATDKDVEVRRAIADIFEDNHRCYGYRRIPASLGRQHLMISEKVVQRLMKQERLVASTRKRRGNDVSARGLQNITSQFTAGKMSDGFAPLGPWLVTRDLVPDPNNLRLQTRMNGEIRQDCNTSEMIFNCRKIISYVTGIMTIEAGDILFHWHSPGSDLGPKGSPGTAPVVESRRQSRLLH